MECVLSVAVVGVIAYVAWKYWLKDKIGKPTDE